MNEIKELAKKEKLKILTILYADYKKRESARVFGLRHS
jgi:hypothetical protein